MTEWILQYKWLFLILGEIIFWVSLLGFFVIRYAFGREQLSKYFILVWIFSDVWLLVLGILDYRHTGTFDTFQVVILIFLFYALTFGRNDMKNLDRWVKRKIKKVKGEPLHEDQNSMKLYGMAYAIKQGKDLMKHVLMFAAVMIVMSFFVDFRGFSHLAGDKNLGDMLGSTIENGWFADPVLGKITGVWTLILIIDTVITVSYFVFPRRAS
ncbi:hypothetical protein ACFSCZ_09065 [Siminovitchia sediminis]|uniref:Uncharacterized protein n=1 Tax=Siminovitchia sediminis TaxID=1274353 RepID=A0ABW4KGN5_9BACI